MAAALSANAPFDKLRAQRIQPQPEILARLRVAGATGQQALAYQKITQSPLPQAGLAKRFRFSSFHLQAPGHTR